MREGEGAGVIVRMSSRYGWSLQGRNPAKKKKSRERCVEDVELQMRLLRISEEAAADTSRGCC